MFFHPPDGNPSRGEKIVTVKGYDKGTVLNNKSCSLKIIIKLLYRYYHYRQTAFLCLYYPVLRLGGLLGIECFDAGVAGGKIGIFYCLYVAARQKFLPRTAVAVYK